MNRFTIQHALVIAGCVVLLVLAVPAIASAHAFLISSSPLAGQRLASSPHTLTLRFTERIVPPASDHLSFDTATGRPVPIGPLRLESGGAVLTAALRHLSAGVYVVNWTVISADDGHPSAGQFAFAVGAGGRLPALSSGTTAPTDWLGAAAGWVFLLGLAVGAGALASSLFIWQPLARGQDWTAPPMPLVTPLILALVAGAALFVVFAARLDPGGAATGAHLDIWSQAAHTRAGFLMLVAFLLVLYALAVSFVRAWRGTALLALGLAGLAAALRSHPAATTSWWGTPAIAIHVVLAILWTGVLVQLVLVFWRQRMPVPGEVMLVAARRYARLALWSMVVVLLSGLGAALSEFTNVGELFTGYGLVLVVKGALVAIALVVALLAQTDVLQRPLSAALALLRGLTRVEAGTLVAVLAASALLSNVAPPFAAPASSTAAARALLGPPPVLGPALELAAKAGWLEVYLTAGQNQLTLRLVTPNDEVPQTTHLHLSALRPGARNGTELFPRSCGPECYNMRFRWQRGITRLNARAGTQRWAGGKLTFAVPWPPLPRDPQLLSKVIAAMRAQRVVALAERTSSSPGASFVHTGRFSGPQFVYAEPYTGHVSDVRPLPGGHLRRQLVAYLAGSNIWVHLWIDTRYRIRRETIVDPGHLIERTFTYPTG